MSNFEQAIEHVLKFEGGYINHKNDTAGETYAGITRLNHPHWPGWVVVDERPRKHNEIIPELNASVKSFYRNNYWYKINADKICNDKVATMLFDFYINSGSIAIKKIQKIVGVEQDGNIGPKTLHAINNYDNGLFARLKMERIGFVKGIVKRNPSQEVFLSGWTRRINSV